MELHPVLLAVLLGVYVGVIPVYLGFFPLPFLRRLGTAGFTFLVAFSVGVLAFLVIDLGAEAMEGADKMVAAMQVPESATGAVPALDERLYYAVGPGLAPYVGYALLVVGLAVGVLGLVAAGRVADRRVAEPGLKLAGLVALGIGLHNLGEGLAVGAAVSAGNLALASVLVTGFAIHNTTEGIAIVGPVAERRALPFLTLVLLGALAGVPTIFGALLGLSVYANALAVVFFAIGAGAVLYVIVEVLAALGKDGAQGVPWGLHGGVAAGLLVMYVTSLFVAL